MFFLVCGEWVRCDASGCSWWGGYVGFCDADEAGSWQSSAVSITTETCVEYTRVEYLFFFIQFSPCHVLQDRHGFAWITNEAVDSSNVSKDLS